MFISCLLVSFVPYRSHLFGPAGAVLIHTSNSESNITETLNPAGNIMSLHGSGSEQDVPIAATLAPHP